MEKVTPGFYIKVSLWRRLTTPNRKNPARFARRNLHVPKEIQCFLQIRVARLYSRSCFHTKMQPSFGLLLYSRSCFYGKTGSGFYKNWPSEIGFYTAEVVFIKKTGTRAFYKKWHSGSWFPYSRSRFHKNLYFWAPVRPQGGLFIKSGTQGVGPIQPKLFL